MFDEPFLAPGAANFETLTPLSFLRRALEVHSAETAVVWRDTEMTYAGFGQLVRRMACWLRSQGIGKGDVVSLILGNRPELLAAHFAVPGIGAVLNTVNTRLNAEEIGYILDHAQSRILIGDNATLGAIGDTQIPVIALCSASGAGDGLDLFASDLAEAELDDVPEDETAAIALNYTSGTTGKPKGVVYTHRGAYLNALGNVIALKFDDRTRYLWTLPMFHCNGWTHTWAVTAAGGTHVCLDGIDPGKMVRLIADQRISHMCCAPVVLYMLLEHMTEPAPLRIKVGTGGAAPTPALIARMEELGFEIVHLYGLTESYGPVTLNDPLFAPSADLQTRAKRLARQGIRHQTTGGVQVLNQQGESVGADGTTIGEIALRGNTLMAGYYRDPEATKAAFRGGVFRTGDLAVLHPNGEIEIQDRAKDIIISGGENFSSLEVEAVLHQHPEILLAAVVAAPDPKWGETAWAYIEVKSGCEPSHQALEDFCRAHLAGFKRPRKFIIGELPKTATGKIQKFALRQRAKEISDGE
mmetsp:Transcript_11010/g.14430  ORF Transcript_11010/g.14430 Transcript_11010/m.14430 type:complete len:526 (+) Transcript_11010:875-2452(+)